ncbi:MAG: site-specific integrase [bacterium]|nr:site-specific integrase [bacterium]
MINRFIAARIRENGWAPKTANSLRQVLHRLFAYAIKHHGFRARDCRYPNPADGVERQSEPAPEIRFLTLEQIDEQLEVLEPCTAMRAMVAVYVYAGLRREEALWLTSDDVNLGKGLLHVRAKTLDGEFWQPKTKRNRAVPISNALAEVLAEYQPRPGSVWFFPSPRGRRWDPDNFSQDLRKANTAAGLPWTCLDFRHTFGSQLAQKGESLFKIATLMGNSPEICRRHYAALVPEAMHESVEFPTVEAREPAENTSRLLRELLHEIRSGDNRETGKPRLRLVRE